MANDTPDTTSKQPSKAEAPAPVAGTEGTAEAALQDAARQVADLSAMASGAAGALADGATPTPGGTSAAFQFPAFGSEGIPQDARALELLGDVNLNVKIELGRTRMLVEDVLRLSNGSVVELDKLAGDPVDIYVNDRYVAKGEVLVLNDNFCVRINEIVKTVVEGDARSQKVG